MKCPKCDWKNLDKATECTSCGVQFADIRPGSAANTKYDKIQRTCPWNDHGQICGLIGSLADSYLGPWYCSTHYWQLKGWPLKAGPATSHVSYRERWYAEHNLPYQPPKSGNLNKLTPAREPGDDEDYVQA